MNIGELAQAAGVTTDTVRYYEKQKLLPLALRQDNGYRRYTPAHLGQLRFVRSAQGLGFSLREIRDILPALNAGRFKRGQIEERLHAKLAVIDRRWLFIGSMNLDPRSATINTELGMVVDSPALAREMLRIIDIDRLQSAYRLRKTADGRWFAVGALEHNRVRGRDPLLTLILTGEL